MKLRIRGNSIRLRLGKSEVQKLATDGEVVESISFGPLDSNRLVYSIKATSSPPIRASFENNRIDISIPLDAAIAWAGNDEVGMTGNQSGDDGQSITILIEKDFECIDGPSDESQADAYPNPLRGAGCA